MERLFATLQRAGHRAQQPLPRLGLHGRQRAQPLRARALHPRRRVRALGDTNLADLQVQGTAPQYTVTQVTELHGRAGRADRAQGGRHHRRAVLPERRRLPAGARFTYLPGPAVPQRIPGNTMAANFTCLIPRVAADGAAGRRRRGPRCTGTACSAARARSPPATSRRWRTSTTSCSARPTGPACRRRTCRTSPRSWPTCRTSRRWPTAPSRAS